MHLLGAERRRRRSELFGDRGSVRASQLHVSSKLNFLRVPIEAFRQTPSGTSTVATVTTLICMYRSSRKIRALECLLSSADDTHLQTCTSSLGSAALRRHLTLLRFVTRLAKLNLPLAEGASAACDVLEDPDKVTLIVESLLKGGGGSIEKVELVADLCLHTSSISPKVWTVLLKQMVQLNMTDRLRSTLLELNRLPQVWHFQEYEEAWRHLLKKPSSDRDECARTLEVLSCCPLALEDLNLDTLRAECKRLGLLEEERRLSTRNKVA